MLLLVGDPGRLPDEIRRALADRENRLLVSAASALEVAIKTRLAKLSVAGLLESWSHRVGDIGAEELAVTAEHAVLAGSMAWEHNDPFDRLLVAQGIVESAVLVTRDQAMVGLPAPRILTV